MVLLDKTGDQKAANDEKDVDPYEPTRYGGQICVEKQDEQNSKCTQPVNIIPIGQIVAAFI